MKRITTRCKQLSLLLSCLLSWHAMDARTWYVKTNGSGSDGSSWATAVPLNYALTTAVATDVIWVAGGVYKPDAAGVAGDRTLAFTLKSGVNLYGSFAGTEMTLAERTVAVIAANPTTLTGDLDGNDVQGDIASHALNSLHIVVANALTSAARLDGFTVKGGGNSNGSGLFLVANGNRYGSGLFCYNSSTHLTVANCVFTDNISANGGAAYHNNSSPAYFDCVFNNNTATLTGGAMRSLSGGALSLTRCKFRQNTALSAGAVELTSASGTVTNCEFISNSATNGSSGAIQFSTTPAANTITSSIFSNNSATSAGGALWASASPTAISNSVFVGNNATGGASTGGGAILSSNGTAMGITGCTFYNNTSNAGIANAGKTIKVDATAANLTLTITNSIIWSTSDATTIDKLNALSPATFTATVNASNSDIKDAATYPGAGPNINLSPLFADQMIPIGVDGIWGTSDDGLRLTCASPCRNTGTVSGPPATDIVGNTRPQGTNLDMGAYEFPEGGSGVSVSITASNTFICTGTNVTFNATNLNVTGTPSYTWYRTSMGGVIGSGATFSASNLNDGESVYCKMDFTDCAGATVQLTSNTIKMAVETTPTLTVTPNTICLGSPLTAALSTGTYMRSFDWKNNGTSVYANADTVAWRTVVAGGTRGSGPAQLVLVNGIGTQSGIFVDNNGTVYVADRFNNRIQKWAAGATTGVTVAGGNGQGGALNQLSEPMSVFVDNAGALYIADRANNRVQKWNAGAITGTTVAGTSGINGNNPSQLGEPVAVVVDNSGNIYIVDKASFSHRVQKWAPGASSGVTVAGITNAPGSTADKLNNPIAIAIDAQNNLYVVDQGNHRIQKWAPGATVGVTVAGTGSAGAGANELSSPTGVYVDENLNIYVGDDGNARIQRFDYGSTIGVTVAQLDATQPLGSRVTGLWVYKNQIYVTEPWQNRVKAYQFPTSASYTPLTAGSHTVSVTTRAGCTVNSNAVSVMQVATAIASTNVPCMGGNGTVTATASGGTAPYTYRLNGAAYGASNTFSVPIGTYQITSKDANGCTGQSSTVTVTEPTVLAIPTPTAGTITCNGGSTSLSATASGGTTPYQYSLDGGTFQNSNFFLVQTGTHYLTVRDLNGCTATSSSVTIAQPIPIALSTPVVGTISCNGGTTSLSTTASDGVAPYEYKLNSGTYQPSNVFTASAGLNTVTTRDVNGCVQTVSVTLTEPTAITNTIASTNIACNGGTATITATATGGTGALQYSIDGINYQATNTFTKPAGTYAVTAKDDNGCTRLSNSLTIGQPAALAVSIAPAATIPSNGTTLLTATVTGGTSPYTYSLNNGTYGAVGANTFTVPSGRDSVRAKDANGCIQLSSTVIIPNMVVSATKTLLCAGVSDTFRATPTNGGATPMYQWKKNNVNVGTNAAMYVDAGLVNGDVVRCDMTASAPSYAMTVIGNAITVTVETQPTATIAPASSCMGTPLTATLSNGTFGSAIWKNNGTTIVGANTANYTSTAGGSHTATITTVAGCVVTSSVATVYQVALTINNGNPVKVLCNGGTAGISVVASGGVAPYQYSLDGGAFSPTGLYSVNAGTYTITGRDANGCTKATTVVVTEPAVLTVDNPIAWPIACFGGTTVLSASARGGNYVYQYSLDGFNYQSTINFTVRAGTYQVVVRDSNGCSASSNLVTIGQPADLIPTATQTAIACIGGTATVTMGTQGGTAPFTYSFNGAAFGTNRVFTGLTAGTYTLSVIDTNLCTKTVNYTVTQPTAVNGSLKVDTVICINTNTQLVVTGTGGTGALSYSLNGGTPQGNAFTVQAGTYNIVISDVNGCKKVLPPVKVVFAQTWAGNTQAVPINCLGTGLLATYPNPANEGITIDFKIPSKSVVVLKIYDMMGRLIQAMDQGTLKGGSYTSRWSTGNLDDATVLICLEVDGVCTQNQKVRIIKR